MIERRTDWLVLLAIIAVCIISFGILIPTLGFYQDDWHEVFFAFQHGEKGLQQLFLYDNRPFAAYYYFIAFSILGFKPIAWHIWILILRCLTILVFWKVIKLIWLDMKWNAAFMALMFSIYPLFKLQPLAVAYSLHWTGYFLYMISLLCMLGSIRWKRWRWFFMPLSWATCILHLLLLEYFIGVELLRFLILWNVFSQESNSIKASLGRVLRWSLPFGIILFAYIYWRAFLVKLPTADHSNTPVLLYQWLSSPFITSITLVKMALQDLIAVVVSVWFQVINPAIFSLDTPFEWAAWIITIFVGLGLFGIFSKLGYLKYVEKNTSEVTWERGAIFLGGTAMILGVLPAWMIGEQIATQNPLWSDRLGLASMFGAAIFFIAVINKVIPSMRNRLVILCLMVALCVGWHVRTINQFRWAWTKQKDLYHQLLWRAPSIQPNTAILTDGEWFNYMGYYPTSFAINTLYAQSKDASVFDQWVFGLYKYFSENAALQELKKGRIIRADKFGGRFSASSLNSLVINYKPEKSRCLWLLRPQDEDVIELPYITRDAVGISNLNRVDPIRLSSKPIAEIIGKEPDHEWCYYYQKAELARSLQDWDQVIHLWQTAKTNHYSPEHGFELLPFIEANVKLERWEQAQLLTLQAFKRSDKLRSTLCNRWASWGTTLSSSREQDEALTQVENELNCSKLK